MYSSRAKTKDNYLGQDKIMIFKESSKIYLEISYAVYLTRLPSDILLERISSKLVSISSSRSGLCLFFLRNGCQGIAENGVLYLIKLILRLYGYINYWSALSSLDSDSDTFTYCSVIQNTFLY